MEQDERRAMDRMLDPSLKIDLCEVMRGVAQDTIGRHRVFHDDGEMHYKDGIGALDQAEMAQPTHDLRNYHENLWARRKEAAIVGLFTAFEVFLRDTLIVIYWADAEKVECILRMNFAEMKNEYADLGLPITKSNGDWHTITRIKAVRNCIVHAGGRVGKERVKKLRGSGIRVNGSTMEIMDEYFEESEAAVTRACERIAKSVQTALREGRIKVKPTVAGLLDSLMKRHRGATWRELSKKAQTLANRLGHTTKWTVGRVRTHARSRDRQSTGRWANWRLVEFEESGGRLIDKS